MSKQEIPKGIYKKLFELRKEVGAVSKNSKNPFYKSKYFDINELLKHLQPHLDRLELLLLQPIEGGEVGTRIIDVESGDSVDSFMPLSGTSNPQDAGKEVSYYRRYTCASLLGLQGEDDDGNTASRSKPDLKEGTPNWKNVVSAIKDGYSLSDIKKKYNVSVDLEKKLINM